MRVPRILWLYVLREVVQYVLLGFFIFGGVLVSQNLFRIVDTPGASLPSLGEVAALLGLLVPIFSAYSVPLAFLFGVLVAMGRMSSDLEVTAMRACGRGMRDLVGPVMIVALLITAGSLYLILDVEPRSRQNLRRVLETLVSRVVSIEPGRFHSIGSRTFFARNLKDGVLQGVVIWDDSDRSQPFTIFAETGSFTFDPATREFEIQLKNGAIHFDSSKQEEGHYRRINFETFDYTFDMSERIDAEASSLKPRDMSTPALFDARKRLRAGEPVDDLRVRELWEYDFQINRRLSLPFAPMVFALVGVPLGLRRSRGARSWGALACGGIALLYYLLSILAEDLVKRDVMNPTLAMWIPNLFFIALAIPLLRRAGRGEV